MIAMSKNAMKPLIQAAVAVVAALWSSIALGAANSIDLAGDWQVAADPKDVGITQQWAVNRFDRHLRLPGTTDEAGIGDLQPDSGRTMGVLVRKHNYLGAAWFAREFTIPSDSATAEWLLSLERVTWQSRVFVDGREVGTPQDSLCAPHQHRLGVLAPGRHRLAIRVDNRMIHPIGNKSHGYGEQTQSRWNGIVGKIELVPVPLIASVRVFTPTLDRVEIEVNTGAGPDCRIQVSLIDPASGQTIGRAGAAPGARPIVLKPDVPVTPWSEFTPKTYRVQVELLRGDTVCEVREASCGFRTVARAGNTLLLNGQPLFLRGNLDCVHFPRTGYPSTDKADWLAIFKKYQAHNLNHVRFHTWCPPEAAFAAADELGLYIQAEGPFWIDNWMLKPNKRLELDVESLPKGIGKNDRSIDAFAKAEFRRILDTYGNHPSFVLFCFGNELGALNFKVAERWIGELKAHDSRRLYAASTARSITPRCDFSATHHIPGVGLCRQHYEFGTRWDYQHLYRRSPVPIIAHEIGQWPVYPDWALCEKFTGTLRNTRLETLREQARANGVFSDQAAFTRTSGALNQRLYKDEIESFLRTPDCRGFQLLSLQDFQGQGESYVGWLDCFWDDKGTTDPAAFRGYCAPVTALAKLPGYTFTDGDTLACELLVRNDGPADLAGATLTAKLLEGATVLAQSSFPVAVVKGKVGVVGKTTFPLAAKSAKRLTLALDLSGKPEANTYPLWVYPKTLPEMAAGSLLVARTLDRETEAALAAGKPVLLLAGKLGGAAATKHAAWMPLYWSAAYFLGQNRDTLGLVVRNTHPAFSDFPTEAFNDWQWYRICAGARGFDLTGLVPESFKPIAQPVTDFHLNRKLGSIFECTVGPGKLLVCGYDLDAPFPETRQLRYSLSRYAGSEAFRPTLEIPLDTLRTLLKTAPGAPVKLPKGFETADFYLVAAGNLTADGKAAADPKSNRLLVAQKDFTLLSIKADGFWKDAACTAWQGGGIGFQLQVPPGAAGTLCVKFNDHNAAGRTGKILCEGRGLALGRHDGKAGHWVRIAIMREDALDGKLTFSAETLSGPNLMITDIAFCPESP